jgi:ABC-type sugar transport system ATPase subunit
MRESAMNNLNAGLAISSISKSYGSTRALTDVSLFVPPGKVVALVGHNGAGKSTLLRALSGAERPDQGTIAVDGIHTNFAQPSDANAAGISCVYQELSLVDQLTVAQNIFLGYEKTGGGVLSLREMNRITQELCDRFGIAARPTDLVGNVPVAQRQMVEVARAVNRGSKYLLLDEPTTALEQEQVEHLLAIIRKLTAEQGIGVLFVDHKLDEVFAIADYVVGLANGRIVLDGPAGVVDRKAVIDAVVGERAAEELERVETSVVRKARPASDFGPPILVADNVGGARLTNINLSVRSGEVLGIYGLVGSGRTRFLRTVYGAEPFSSGSFTLNGKPFWPKRPQHAITAGIAFVSEERKFDGIIPQLSGEDNVAMPILDRYVKAGVLNWKRLHGSANDALRQVSIRGDVRGPISALSGGNQQKALFAKAALQAPLLLLLDEPTKGVDIGAKAEIYGIIENLAHQKGVAVIVVSSEEEELITVADTITVFRAGSCDGAAFANSSVTPQQLRELAWADTDTLST